MKKVFISIALLTLIFITSGCGVEKEKTLSCSYYTKDVTSNYEMDSTYEITYKGDIVTKVVTIETVTSSDIETLNYFKEYLDEVYETMNETYGGYTFSVEIEGDTVTSTATIDYSKVDLDQLSIDSPEIKDALDSNNNFTLDGAISIYESIGITCDEK
jgi:uncharacterized lipoprotein YehR (DUF1307 family)